jgi:hypothetical protein
LIFPDKTANRHRSNLGLVCRFLISSGRRQHIADRKKRVLKIQSNKVRWVIKIQIVSAASGNGLVRL